MSTDQTPGQVDHEQTSFEQTFLAEEKQDEVQLHLPELKRQSNKRHLIDSPEKEEKKDNKRELHFSEQIIPLQDLIHNFDDVIEVLKKEVPLEERKKGPCMAFLQFMLSMCMFWHHPSPTWRNKLRKRFCVGFIKDTKQYGNTSVSMGVFTKKHSLLKNKELLCLNCGTGGIKFQYFINIGAECYVMEEKPGKNTSFLSPNDLEVFDETAMHSYRKQLTAELQQVKQKFNIVNKDIVVVAVITGTLRAKRFNDPDKYAFLDNAMRNYFPAEVQPHTPGQSFFITQAEEAFYEYLGARGMYNLLSSCEAIENGIGVVGSFGIGKGSGQMHIQLDPGLHADDGILLQAECGMDNEEELQKLSSIFYDQWSKNIAWICDNETQLPQWPTIAVKSGPALFLEAYPAVKLVLLTMRDSYIHSAKTLFRTANSQ